MATQGYYDFSARNGVFRVLYEYTQDVRNNTSSIRLLGAQFKSTNAYGFTFIGDGVVTLSANTAVSTSWNNGSGATSDSVWIGQTNVFYDLGSGKETGWVTLSHDANGNGSIGISIGPRGSTGFHDFNVFCLNFSSGNWSYSPTTVWVALPQIDRSAPAVTSSVSAASTSSVSLSATSNVNCDIWQYKVDNGSWVTFSSTNGTSASTTITGLSSASHTIYVQARKNSNYVYGSASAKTVDLVAPTITVTPYDITPTSLKVSVSANVTCNDWQWRLSGGSWSTFSSTSGTSAVLTLNNLTPNVTYALRIQARKASNGLYSATSSFNVTTLGPTLINSANDFAVDGISRLFRINVTAYSTFYHILNLKSVDGSLIVWRPFGTVDVGTHDVDVELIPYEISVLQTLMSSVKTMPFDVSISTYSGPEYTDEQLVGITGSKRVTLTTSEASSAPTLPAFTYLDNNTAVTDVTNNNQVLLQGYSDLLVHLAAATAKNGASITGYSLSIGDISLSTTALDVDMGAISSSGILTLTVTASDTRGYSATRQVAINVMPYNDPRMNTLTLRRRNEIDALIELSFTGSVSSVQPSSSEVNHVSVIKVRWKKTSDDTWGSWVNLLPSSTITGLYFSYSTLELTELDTESSFDFEFIVQDAFGSLTDLDITVVLAQGTPLIAFRKRSVAYPFPRVGINTPSPTEALDVNGNIKASGAIFNGNVRMYNQDKSEYADVSEAMMKMLQSGVTVSSDAGSEWYTKGTFGMMLSGTGTLDIPVVCTRPIKSAIAYCFTGTWIALQFRAVSCPNSPLKILRFNPPSGAQAGGMWLCAISSVTYDD